MDILRFRKAKELASIAAALVLAMAFVPSTAQAHRGDHGGKWGSRQYSYYMNLNGHTWYADNVIRPAAGKWGSYTGFSIYEGSISNAPVSVTVNQYAADWYGSAYPGPNKTCCTYTYGVVKLNHNLLQKHFRATQKDDRSP
ncbi:MAG: hypothetical protein ACR2KQ_09965 [Actinomycetota bacterium]